MLGGGALRRTALRRNAFTATRTSSSAAAAIRLGTMPVRPAERRMATTAIHTSDTGISSFQPSAMNWS